MTPLEILTALRRCPFEPFDLILLDGARYEIAHPDLCMVLTREVLIGLVTETSKPFVEWTIKLNCRSVLRIEPAREHYPA